MLAWFEATGREEFLARAADIHAMMAARFFQERKGILAEYFDGDWSPRDGIAGRICEPGHHFEWSHGCFAATRGSAAKTIRRSPGR
jgi:mannose/cellobiose epimerase-like protein (N-acyl-D-glucosamine 2-epimerase family)